MKNESDSNSKALMRQLQPQETDVLNLDLQNNYEQSLLVLTEIAKSKKMGKINTPAEALTYYLKSKELGVPFITSIDHMFDAGGKTNIDAHLMRALVLKARVTSWIELHNAAPLYKYTDGTNIIATGTNDSCIPDTCVVIKGDNNEELKAHYDSIKSARKLPLFKELDVIPVTNTLSVVNRETAYEFTRALNMAGEDKIIKEIGSFSIREAFNAGLHLMKDSSVNLSSPWIVYYRNMLEHRAWTFGVRKIADDVIFGLLDRTEYLDMEKIPYTIDEGQVTVIEEPNK